MIKKQYRRSEPGYFNNFIHANNPDSSIEEGLAPHRATLAKSKNKHYILNVKWHDSTLYTLFVLKWS